MAYSNSSLLHAITGHDNKEDTHRVDVSGSRMVRPSSFYSIVPLQLSEQFFYLMTRTGSALRIVSRSWNTSCIHTCASRTDARVHRRDEPEREPVFATRFFDALQCRTGFHQLRSVGKESDIMHWSMAHDRTLKEVVVRAAETVFRWSKGAGRF